MQHSLRLCASAVKFWLSMFRKVLIANRGEIAVRVIRTLREMGICSVAVYSDADRAALHVRMADEAAHVGPSPSSESYLRIDRILDAARAHRAEAIHPGYGFLSENADFAAGVRAAGIVFIGPSADTIRKMGSKTAAREVAIAAGAPVVPGMQQPAENAVWRACIRPRLRISGSAQGRGRRRRQRHAACGSRRGNRRGISRCVERSRTRVRRRGRLRRKADRTAAPH